MFFRVLFVLAAAVCAGALPAQAETASWYEMGHITANGRLFSRAISASNPYIAAHKTLPFGTHVLITNLGNGRQQCVSIEDRGPYVGGVSYDLTRAAAENLGFDGHARVKAEVGSRCWVGNLPPFAHRSLPLHVSKKKHKKPRR
ncbi:MAG TPA: RlpA-like double-psi beta-barrel domain-containing protein [Candidatus Paceibacterota bacterium]|nr:RlpA-like double-psi beta-barrel domain-containing protein [Candidatus Paceibacterota bacterium]